MKPLRHILTLGLLLSLFISPLAGAQDGKKINITHPGDFTKDEIKYPGADIMSKTDRQVQFEHDGIDLWCDVAVFYRKENRIKAFGNVYFQQGDSIKLNSDYAEYDANAKIALAQKNVQLRNNTTTLSTESVRFDRNTQVAYYDQFGTVQDTANTLTSNQGSYYLEARKYEFKSDVHIVNKDYDITSARLDYYTESRNVYMYGPSTIKGQDYTMYCERGFYNTALEQGYGVKNTRIDYNQRIIHGDSLFFDKKTEFASATNNIKVIDTVNKGMVRGHYAEVFKAKDSVFVTKRALAISVVEGDSLYFHGDTLMVTGKEGHRVIRAFKDARFYKSDLSGKADSIHSDQATGITKFLTFIPENTPENEASKRRPILWSGESQMTGDTIQLRSNVKTEQLDSLLVLGNAFIIQLDSLSHTSFKDPARFGYNQIKGKNLYGHFESNELRRIEIVKNAELIYYLWNDKEEFMGIDKRRCGSIEFVLADSEIKDITSYNTIDGEMLPDDQIPVNSRKFRGFLWRGDEMIRGVRDLFTEEDLNLKLPTIKGIEEPTDLNEPYLAPAEFSAQPMAAQKQEKGKKKDKKSPK